MRRQTGGSAQSSITATPAPSESCGCPNASAGITAATCNAACAGGGTAGTYVAVNAQASYSTPNDPGRHHHGADRLRLSRMNGMPLFPSVADDTSRAWTCQAGQGGRRRRRRRAGPPAADVPDVPSRDRRIRASSVDAAGSAIRGRGGSPVGCRQYDDMQQHQRHSELGRIGSFWSIRAELEFHRQPAELQQQGRDRLLFWLCRSVDDFARCEILSSVIPIRLKAVGLPGD